MSRMHSFLPLTLLLTLAVFLATPADAKKRKKLLHDIPMVWSPTDEIGDLGVVDLTKLYDRTIQFGTFTDKRKDPELIAKNIEDQDDGVVLEVTTTDDIGEWVGSQFALVFEGLGLTLEEEGGDVIVEGEVRRFFVTEDSTYKGDVGVLLTVKSKSGENLWKGMVSGTAGRWGRSYSKGNYFETLSDSTLEAIHNAISDRNFRKALAGESSN
ncbi:MAG: hypothetical protein K0U98_08715 [Deltaproteobacteria bacterium]|nr:hypothetical protein [Deltaproteobacteria bacterium]